MRLTIYVCNWGCIHCRAHEPLLFGNFLFGVVRHRYIQIRTPSLSAFPPSSFSFVPSPRTSNKARQQKKNRFLRQEKKRNYPTIHTMSSNVPISGPDITAPTPQNTPLNQGPIALGLSRPTVPAISEDGEEGSDDPMDGTDGPLPDHLQQHMVGMVQSKLAGLLGKSSGYIEGLPVDVKLNVEALKGVQVKHNELQNKYKLECLALERKVCFLFCCSFSFFLFFVFGFFFGKEICNLSWDSCSRQFIL